MEGTYNCPKCGIRHSVSVRHGYRYNKSGRKRFRKCKGCGTKITPDNGFLRRRFQKVHIAEAVCLHESGLSPGKVKEHMQQRHGIEVSRWMISLWCRDYSRVMDKFTETVMPDVKGNVHAGEVIVIKDNKYLDEI